MNNVEIEGGRLYNVAQGGEEGTLMIALCKRGGGRGV